MDPQKSKPGYRTTEFWLALVATLAGAVMASGALAEGSTWDRLAGAVVAALASVGYTVGRSTVKKGGA